jgi:hypothetical protein
VKEDSKDFQINYKTKKFKYDSSDTEDDEEINNKSTETLSKPTKSIGFNIQNDSLFFLDNDPRFSGKFSVIKN